MSALNNLIERADRWLFKESLVQTGARISGGGPSYFILTREEIVLLASMPKQPIVGSRWQRKDGTDHPRTVTQVPAPMVFTKGERLEHMEPLADFLERYKKDE
jgi:hypothetical protein